MLRDSRGKYAFEENGDDDFPSAFPSDRNGFLVGRDYCAWTPGIAESNMACRSGLRDERALPVTVDQHTYICPSIPC